MKHIKCAHSRKCKKKKEQEESALYPHRQAKRSRLTWSDGGMWGIGGYIACQYSIFLTSYLNWMSSRKMLCYHLWMLKYTRHETISVYILFTFARGKVETFCLLQNFILKKYYSKLFNVTYLAALNKITTRLLQAAINNAYIKSSWQYKFTHKPTHYAYLGNSQIEQISPTPATKL